MAGLDSGELAEDALALVRRTLDRILDQALGGIGPLPSVADLASEYRRPPYANDPERDRH